MGRGDGRQSGRWRIGGGLAGALLALAAPVLAQPALASAGDIYVSNTNDSGTGSLRQAILDANARPGLDFIKFAIGSGAQTISLHSPLPAVSDPADIDGRTQPGFTGSPIVELDGSAAGGGPGLLITAGHSAVRGLVINRFAGDGIFMSIGFNVIEGNFIGTDLTGTVARGNQGNGVVLFTATFGSRIGGTAPGQRNVISGNLDKGVIMFGGSDGNAVQGNLIGTDVTGTVPLGNRFWGVFIDNSSDNLIGGSTPGSGNVIAASTLNGLAIVGHGSRFNVVQGNLIGTDATGEHPIGNGQDGVLIADAAGNRIGADSPDGRNVISASGLNGIDIVGSGTTGNIVQGNYIGTDAAGTHALGNALNGVTVGNVPGNTVSGNLVSGNLNSGVLIYGSGGTGNTVAGNRLGTDASGTAGIGNSWWGVALDGAPGNTIGGTTAAARNLASGNLRDGILLAGPGSSGNLVEGNFVGTDASGTSALPNAGNGMNLDRASQNTIGGNASGSRNVISGNRMSGVVIGSGTGNAVEGNYLGPDATGAVALPNGGNGVVLVAAAQNTIGGTSIGSRNVISANGTSGIVIDGGSFGNAVQGNFIGVDASGSGALGNAFIGVYVVNSRNNLIGGSSAGAGNVISASGLDGVNIGGGDHEVVQGNLIGTDATGRLARGNRNEGVFVYSTTQALIGGTTPGARNVIAASGANGINIGGAGATENVVQGNYIGTDVTGTEALGNSFGVTISSVPGNTIGGTQPGAGNLISGNSVHGLVIYGLGGRSNTVQGNLIGTDAAGTAPLGNEGWGLLLEGAPGNTIGGTVAGARNIISGNHLSGIQMGGADTTGNLIQGNLIGTDASGTSPVPNSGNGVTIEGEASRNTVGGVVSGAGNVIAYNTFGGVVLGSGTGDAIRANSIFSNGGLGIDLGGDWITANDPGDGDSGPNDRQNFPVLSRAVTSPAGLVVIGSIDTPNPQAVTIEIFASSVPVPGADPSGYGEGQTFLGSVTPNRSGRFTLTLPPVPKGTVISATATDAAGNTSEFAFDVVAGP